MPLLNLSDKKKELDKESKQEWEEKRIKSKMKDSRGNEGKDKRERN